ncbi:MAG: transposase, partial [Candidatus Aenigmatarchaeota archaeon]
FPSTRLKLRKGHIWSPSYYVGTAGTVTAETIQKYIREQEKGYSRNSSPQQVGESPCELEL